MMAAIWKTIIIVSLLDDGFNLKKKTIIIVSILDDGCNLKNNYNRLSSYWWLQFEERKKNNYNHLYSWWWLQCLAFPQRPLILVGTHRMSTLDSIAASYFVDILAEFDGSYSDIEISFFIPRRLVEAQIWAYSKLIPLNLQHWFLWKLTKKSYFQ